MDGPATVQLEPFDATEQDAKAAEQEIPKAGRRKRAARVLVGAFSLGSRLGLLSGGGVSLAVA